MRQRVGLTDRHVVDHVVEQLTDTAIGPVEDEAATGDARSARGAAQSGSMAADAADFVGLLAPFGLLLSEHAFPDVGRGGLLISRAGGENNCTTDDNGGSRYCGKILFRSEEHTSELQ